MKGIEIYKPETVFNFGKHQGRTLEDVASTDFQYIIWCLLNVDHFFVEKELVLAYQTKYKKKLIDEDKSGKLSHIGTLNSVKLSEDQMIQLEVKWNLMKVSSNKY